MDKNVTNDRRDEIDRYEEDVSQETHFKTVEVPTYPVAIALMRSARWTSALLIIEYLLKQAANGGGA